MKQEIAQQWSAALRSGKYVQGFSRLAIEFRPGERRHCCLGVLCEIVGRTPSGSGETLHYHVDGEEAGSGAYVLPAGVKEAAGMSTSDGLIRTVGSQWLTLAHANDSNVPFPEIADMIDANWETL